VALEYPALRITKMALKDDVIGLKKDVSWIKLALSLLYPLIAGLYFIGVR
jgi:hypothetical protein